MKESICNRLRQIAERYEEIGLLLGEPDVFTNQNRFRELSREYSRLEPLVNAWKQWQQTHDSIQEARQLLTESDADLRAMAGDEIAREQDQLGKLEREIQLLLLPQDPNDEKNIFLDN